MERAQQRPLAATSSGGTERRDRRRTAISPPAVEQATDRKLLGAMLLRELAELRVGLRFRAAWLLIVGLMAASAVINSARYGAEEQIYRDLQADYAAELAGRSVADLATIPHPAVKKPWKLAFLVEGGQPSGANVYLQPLSPWSLPEVESWHDGGRVGSTEPLDWLFVIRVILSLLAFVLGYDAFCGERQRSALRMILSYPVARWQVFGSKLVAIWACLAGPFVLGGAVSLLILSVYGDMQFSAMEWGKIGLVLILGLWASGVFVLMALAVSALSRQASRSLALLALVWVAAVVVIPAASGVAVHAIQPLLAGSAADQQMKSAKEEAEVEGPGTWRSWELAKDSDYLKERHATETQYERYRSQETLRRQLIVSQLDQIDRSRRLAAVSPMALVQDLAERLVGTGPYRDRDFFEQAWEFRDDLEKQVKALDNADPESPHLHFVQGYMSQERFNPETVPKFKLVEVGLSEGLAASRWLILALSLATAALAAVVLLLFVRFDVG